MPEKEKKEEPTEPIQGEQSRESGTGEQRQGSTPPQTRSEGAGKTGRRARGRPRKHPRSEE